MRGPLPFLLPANHQNQFIRWFRSPDENKLRARNSQVMLLLDDGHDLDKVAEKTSLCRQTVSEIRRTYLIFGPDGIVSCTPILGRRYCAVGGRLRTILEIAHEEKSIDGASWTEMTLSKRCEVSNPTLHRLLKRHGVILENTSTIEKALAPFALCPMGIAGFLGNTSIRAMAFWCTSGDGTIVPTTQTLSPTFNVGNTQAFLLRQSEQFNICLRNMEKEIFKVSKSDRHDHRDMLRFMDILDRKGRGRRDLSLIANTSDIELMHKLMRYVEGHHSFHLLIEDEEDRWIASLREKNDLIDGRNKRKVALQMENINVELEKWRNGPLRELGTFVWFDNLL